MSTLTIKTTKRVEVVDITKEVEKFAAQASSLVLVYSPHTTTAVIINEAEEGLIEDILNLMDKLVPQASYKHNRVDSNADSHLKATLLGNSAVIPVENGKLALGTWQRVLFIEFDGPRTRKVVVRAI